MGKKKDFDRIVKLVNYNEDKKYVLPIIKKYISEYGISDGILDQLGRLYIHNEEFENAKDCLIQVKNKYTITLYQLLIANFVLKDYKEVINIYNDLMNTKSLYNQLSEKMLLVINRLNLYSKFKLGISDNFKKIDLIINYNREMALRHIKKHTFEVNYKEKHSLFNSDIDIENLYNDIENSINDSNKAYTDYLIDCYYFGYYNIGKIKNKQCDYLSVITLHDSNKIISMFPITLKEIKDYHPINKVKEDYKKLSKNKKLSQIDKFNLKYNKKLG